jgi:hypothetical protein
MVSHDAVWDAQAVGWWEGEFSLAIQKLAIAR